jgi:predicted metal-dependent hydrolase
VRRWRGLINRLKLPKIGVSPAAVGVRNFKSRWGSCDKKGEVVFNWNIIKAPHNIVD